MQLVYPMLGAAWNDASLLGIQVTVCRRHTTDDVAAPIDSKLGVPLDLIAHAPDGRPIRLIEGRVIREWM